MARLMAAPTPPDVLPDVLAPGLHVVFCGSAAGAVSARVGAYYAGPGNRSWPTLHRVGLTPRLLAPTEFRIVLRWIADDHRAKGGEGNARVAFMHNASPFGLSPWVQGGEDYAREIGVDVTPYEMPRGATDYTAEFTRIGQAEATYVVFQNTSAPAAVALRNARGLGVDATFVCLNWCANALLWRLAGDAAEGVVGAIPWAPLTDDVPGVRDIRAYLESEEEDYREKTNAYTQGWWTMGVFAEGIRRVLDAGDELTGENIRLAMETIDGLDTGGAGPPLTFTPSDHRGSKGLRLFRAEDGMWSPLTEFLDAPS